MKSNELTLARLRESSGGVKQSVVAASMQMQEPAISKLERKDIKQTNLQKMARYIEALGGRLDITITLADGSIIQLEDLCV